MQMGKSNKHRKKGQDPSSKLEEDPILVVASARPDKGSHGGETSASSITVKHIEIDGRSIAVMFHNGATVSNEADIEVHENLSEVPKQGPGEDTSRNQLEDVLQTLGDEDSSSLLGVRQNAQEKPQCESPAAGKGPIPLGEVDFQGSNCSWERCLVGYFGGDPRKTSPNQIVASWKVHTSIQFHGSEWVIFQFGSIEDQAKVLENGPYIIYGNPLLLKPMSKYFSFGKEAINTFPSFIIWGTPAYEEVTNLESSDILESILENPETEHRLAQPPEPNPRASLYHPSSVGGEIYRELANQIASEELQSKLQQASKIQKDSSATGTLNKGIVQPAKRHAQVIKASDKVSSSSPNPSLSGVLKFLKTNKVAIMGIMETKLNHQMFEGIARNKFFGWRVANNFIHHPNGRILVIWKEDLVQLDIVEAKDQDCTGLNSDMVSRGKRLDPGQAVNLTQQVTKEEIKNALFSIGEDKSPCPDSFSFCFFKKAWDIMGKDFIAAVMEFFSSG
ncbi:hypothetical protein Acr_00g0086040 [Actinidia rufa]|uniref:DUF4283 domain-containing protein n=1 Tax=Actinidia rufa TaxID=165716 RepID=A0A7J0DXG4_9ERIC|nr:hypothetical protein Acr_00g0086040 [Actinidia rufa]